MAKKLGVRQVKLIEQLVQHFIKSAPTFKLLEGSLNNILENSAGLKLIIHSFKSRIKDPAHLRDKLLRKANEANLKGEEFDYSTDNLFSKINDLVGFRILHLHTTQFEQINNELLKIFSEQNWQI